MLNIQIKMFLKICYQLSSWGAALNCPISNRINSFHEMPGMSIISATLYAIMMRNMLDGTKFASSRFDQLVGLLLQWLIIMTNFMTIAISIIIPRSVHTEEMLSSQIDENLYYQDLTLRHCCLNCCIFQGIIS